MKHTAQSGRYVMCPKFCIIHVTKTNNAPCCITVGPGIVSVHTALGCHWLVAGVDCALLCQFLHTPAVDSLLELVARYRK